MWLDVSMLQKVNELYFQNHCYPNLSLVLLLNTGHRRASPLLRVSDERLVNAARQVLVRDWKVGAP